MNRYRIASILFLSAVWLSLCSYAQAVTGMPARIVHVKNGDDLVLALELDGAISAISGPVTKCLSRGEALRTCQCNNLEAVKNLHRVAERILKQRPQWDADDVVLYWETRDAEHPIISHNIAIKPVVNSVASTERDCASRVSP